MTVMTILSLSKRTIEGWVQMPTILGGPPSNIQIKRSTDIQGTLDSIEELMDLKGSLHCNLKIIHSVEPTRYAFIKGDMKPDEFRDRVAEVCREFC